MVDIQAVNELTRDRRNVRFTYTCVFTVVHLGGNETQKAIEGFRVVAQAVL